MSKKNFTPVNQVRLTNVVVVRLKQAGVRFEIACYPNKVLPWRQKIETDINEVLQSERVFQNVSKGVFAKKSDLEACFGTDDEKEVCLQILEKGELQVSSKERQHQYESMFRDIATIVAEKCINPYTQKPLTVGVVERAMKDIHYSIKPGRPAKTQALIVIKLLQEKPEEEGGIPIQRALMRLEISSPRGAAAKLKEGLQPLIIEIENEENEEVFTITCTIDPGNFRPIHDLVTKMTRGKGSVEILDVCVQEEGDELLE